MPAAAREGNPTTLPAGDGPAASPPAPVCTSQHPAKVAPPEPLDNVPFEPGGKLSKSFSSSPAVSTSAKQQELQPQPPLPATEPASPSTSKALPSTASQHRGRRVVLRVEVATQFQARLLTYTMWVLNLIFIFAATTVLSLRETDMRVGQLRLYYLAELIIGTICLGLLLATTLWFTLSIARSRREARVWSKRQAYFTRTAVMLLGLQLPYSTLFVAGFALVLSQDNCTYPWITLAAMEYVQWIFFISTMLLLLARLQNMTLWRGRGALDMHPDARLTLDRPVHDILRNHAGIVLLWLVLCCVSIASMVDKITRVATKGERRLDGGCDAHLGDLDCGQSPTQVAVAVVSFALILVYVGWWAFFMRRAINDHARLPYNRYRPSLIFVRVQLRVVAPVLVAVTLSTLFLTVIPAFKDSCWTVVDSQLGNLPAQMALSVLTLVHVILYMPKAKELDSPVLQEFLQCFAWTQAGVPAAVEQRNQLLMETEAEDAPDENAQPAGTSPEGQPLPRASFTGVVSQWQEELRAGLARLARVPDVESAAQQLRREPLFCMETAVKLFYWMRLAYRDDDALTYKFVNARDGLRLFGVDHFETIWDETTDTHAALGWNHEQCVVAFRGTKSMQNVLTDLKAWMAPLKPHRRRYGQLVKVHAGFLNAWRHSGFNTKVLERLKEVDSGPSPLRFWVVGHSLGGALASLAALDIARQHPRSQLTCYTYGCPRVGNRAFAAECEELVPDTWAVINGLDPIPWVPGFGYRRVGKLAFINAQGDLILRPTYFELSLTHRGTSAKHHLTGSYALSFAAILRAQYVPSKALPGGPVGAASLATSVNLSTCLVLSNMDAKSLAVPDAQPVLLELLAARAAAKERRKKRQSVRAARRTATRKAHPRVPFAPWFFCWRRGETLEEEAVADGSEVVSAMDEEDEETPHAVVDDMDSLPADAEWYEAGASSPTFGDGGPSPSTSSASAAASLQRKRWWRRRHQRLSLSGRSQSPGSPAAPSGTESSSAVGGSGRRRADSADPSGEEASSASAGRRRPTSLHSQRYPTFRLSEQETDSVRMLVAGQLDDSKAVGQLQQPGHEQQDSSTVAPAGPGPSPFALQQQPPNGSRGALRRPSLQTSSLRLAGSECSMHSALSAPDQLLIEDATADEPS